MTLDSLLVALRDTVQPFRGCFDWSRARIARETCRRAYVLLASSQDKTIDCNRLLRFLLDAAEMQEVAIVPLESDLNLGG